VVYDTVSLMEEVLLYSFASFRLRYYTCKKNSVFEVDTMFKAVGDTFLADDESDIYALLTDHQHDSVY